jgi:hypothetical protein
LAIVAPTMLLTSMVIVAPNGEAADSHQFASPSAFCTTIKTFAVAEPPTFITISAYHVWAKLYLTSYEKLASEAPRSSVKKLLNEVVAILKYEGKATSLTKLKRYVATNTALWKKAVTQLFQSGITCASHGIRHRRT